MNISLKLFLQTELALSQPRLLSCQVKKSTTSQTLLWLEGTSAGKANFLTLHYPSSSQTPGTTSTFKVALHVPGAAVHVYLPPRMDWMERVLYNDLSFSLKCHLFLHCILSVRSMLSLVQLCSCSYSAQTSSKFCTHTKSFLLPFEKSGRWLQSRWAQSLHRVKTRMKILT